MGDAKLGGAVTRENVVFYYPEDPSVTSTWDPPEVGLTLVTDKNHPLWDPRLEMPLLRSRIDNFKVFGVRDPIGIRKNPATGQQEVVDGRRRVQHLRQANIELLAEGKPRRTIPCMRKTFTDREAVADMAIRNAHREEETANDQAVKIRQLLFQGFNKHDVALIYGLAESTIDARLALLEMVPEFQDAVNTGRVAASTAASVARKTPDEQREALAALLSTGDAGKGFANKNSKRSKSAPVGAVGGKAAALALGKKILLGKKPIQKFLDRPDVHPVARHALTAVLNGTDLADPAVVAALCGWTP